MTVLAFLVTFDLALTFFALAFFFFAPVVLLAPDLDAASSFGSGASVNFTFSFGTISTSQQVSGSSDFLVRPIMVSFLHLTHSYSPAWILSIELFKPFLQ